MDSSKPEESEILGKTQNEFRGTWQNNLNKKVSTLSNLLGYCFIEFIEEGGNVLVKHASIRGRGYLIPN